MSVKNVGNPGGAGGRGQGEALLRSNGWGCCSWSGSDYMAHALEQIAQVAELAPVQGKEKLIQEAFKNVKSGGGPTS